MSQINALRSMPGGMGLGAQLADQVQSQLQAQNASAAQQPSFIEQNAGNLENQYNNELQEQQGVQGQQQDLATQLSNTAAGKGPNPATSLLTNAQNQAAKQAAGTVASTKGINPALAARLAGQQAAELGQEGANQAATLQAQQSLAAQGELGGVLNGMSQADLQNAALAQQAIQGQNSQVAGMNESQNNVNAQVAGQNAAANRSTAGGIIGGIGSLASSLFNKGGKIKGYDNGGSVSNSNSFADALIGASKGMRQADQTEENSNNILAKGISSLGTLAGRLVPHKSPVAPSVPAPTPNVGPISGLNYAQPANRMFGVSTAPQLMAQLPKAPARVPAVPQSNLQAPQILARAHGGSIDFRAGGDVPGRATVEGDSPKNDTVPAMLSPGEIVIPRSKANSPEAAKEFVEKVNHKENPEKAQEFVKALQGSKPKKTAVPGPKEGYAKLLHAHRLLDQRLKALETSKMKKTA